MTVSPRFCVDAVVNDTAGRLVVVEIRYHLPLSVDTSGIQLRRTSPYLLRRQKGDYFNTGMYRINKLILSILTNGVFPVLCDR